MSFLGNQSNTGTADVKQRSAADVAAAAQVINRSATHATERMQMRNMTSIDRRRCFASIRHPRRFSMFNQFLMIQLERKKRVELVRSSSLIVIEHSDFESC